MSTVDHAAGWADAAATTPSSHARSSDLWLFSAPVDLAAFLGSACVALLALALSAPLDILHQDTPAWAWVSFVLLIDVAHVWATAFRVYLDPTEWQRRPLLYVLVPLLGFVVGVVLYAQGSMVFWRVLAYVAVFHFVRQQYGWVALYRAKRGETERLGKCIDTSAIYLATIYPLIYWHAMLPLHFWWFLEGDFVTLPALCERVARPVYWSVLALYGLRALYLWFVVRKPNPGKDIVVATTALCWYLGIVAFNSDYAFTVTNVIIHGVPYFVLVYWYWHQRRPTGASSPRSHLRSVVLFLATVWLLAYVEEMLWHRSIWHRHGWLFGGYWQVGPWDVLLVPLLAVPQLTHYILDGFIWKRRSNPRVALLTTS